jgi:hypothetical protein
MLEAHPHLRGGVKPMYEARPRGRHARSLGGQPLAAGPPVFSTIITTVLVKPHDKSWKPGDNVAMNVIPFAGTGAVNIQAGKSVCPRQPEIRIRSGAGGKKSKICCATYSELCDLQWSQVELSHVFLTERDGPMTPKAFHALFSRIGARAKIPFPIHRTCCATAAAMRWQMLVTIRGRCKPISGTRISNTRCATRN